MRSAVRQKGAVAIVVALSLLFLLGFMGIALDFGHLFVAKDELQTSVDACALSAAQELDGSTDAITRATNAGLAAGNSNKVDFQSSTWSGQGKLVASDVTFKDAAYGTTTVAASARYVQCQHSQGGIKMWLIQAMGASVGSNNQAYAATNSVGALAVATRASAQSSCPIPVAVKAKTGGTAPNYGFQVGEWVTVLSGTGSGSSGAEGKGKGDDDDDSGSSGGGEVGWYNLDGSNSASETALELGEPGRCGVKVGDTLGTPGAKQSVSDVWNARFGIYKNGDPGPTVNHPDYTGYTYTSTNWTNAVPQNAYAGTPAKGSAASAANYKTKRLSFASYADTSSDIDTGDGITGLKMKGGYKTLATPGTGGQHKANGYNRRIVTVPVISSAGKVVDFACVLLLQPMTSPTVDVQMEFLGNAGSASSPCTSNGLAGGLAGPKVPVLVQ